MTVESVQEHRGRLLAWVGRYDDRSLAYPARAEGEEVVYKSITRRDPLLLDQGETGTCVAQAGIGQLAAGPNPRSDLSEADALTLYDYIKTNIDREPDPERQAGTSILSLCKAMKALGYISEYRWMFSVDDIVHTISNKTTVLAGTDWTDSMFEPDENGYVKVEGKAVGGHAYLFRGNAIVREHVRARNSWGLYPHSIGGDFRLRYADLEKLVDRQGEFAAVTETV